MKNKKSDGEIASTEKSVLKTALYSDVATFHLSSSNKGSYVNSSYVIPWLFEGLMRKGPQDEPQLAIAEKVDISRDKTTYTFHLRDTKWSDGVPLTAYDFEFAWKKLIDPQSKALAAQPELFYPIKNVRQYIQGECTYEETGIKIINKKTITLELEYPAHYFLEIACSPFLLPAPKHLGETDPNWADKVPMVSNGPFTLQNRKLNAEINLARNPQYWDSEHVYLKGIDVYIMQDYLTALNLYETGELDWIGAPFIRMPYETSHQILDQRGEDAIIYFFVFNNDKYPFTNQKFRKALSYALDRTAITDNIFHDTAVPTMSAFPFSLRQQNRPGFEDNNVELAQTLFAEALEELGLTLETFPEIELVYNTTTEISRQLCLAAQDDWRKKLNLKVTLKGLTGWNHYIDTLQRGDYQMGITGTMVPIFDPLFALQIFENKTDLKNRCNWEHPKFKDLLMQSNHSIGEIERSKILADAEVILLEEMPIIPMCSMKKSYAKNPKLQGEVLSYTQFVDFKSAYFEK
ncbi:MAG: peptide ABC transporter substrate-binding protein [Chlamydiia bacterium]|nr:peptide ABC transporter substrate-binding protein [Chlamydiia bacterium]